MVGIFDYILYILIHYKLHYLSLSLSLSHRKKSNNAIWSVLISFLIIRSINVFVNLFLQVYTQCTSLKNTVKLVRWLYVTNKNIASLPFCIIIYNGLAWSSLYVSFFALWNISDDTKHRCLITEKTCDKGNNSFSYVYNSNPGVSSFTYHWLLQV